VVGREGGVTDPLPLAVWVALVGHVARAHGCETIHIYAIPMSAPFSIQTIPKSQDAHQHGSVSVTLELRGARERRRAARVPPKCGEVFAVGKALKRGSGNLSERGSTGSALSTVFAAMDQGAPQPTAEPSDAGGS